MNGILGNFGKVLRGRSIAAILGVCGTALMAHALPVEQFGLVILLHTYVLVIKGFLNFRSFEAIVRFGIPLLDSKQEDRLKSLLRSTMWLDLASSGIATIVGITAVPLAAWLLHWDPQLTSWATLYSLILLSTPTNTGSGILRLYDRFDALGVQYVVAPLVRLVLFAAAWLMDATMLGFILCWGLSFCVGNIYMIARGLTELRRNLSSRLWQDAKWTDVKEQGRGFWNFIVVVYWQTSIDLLPKHVSTLLAGALLGPAAAGLFRLARDVATVLNQPAVMLREVLFPDLTRSWNSKQGSFSASTFRTAMIAGGTGMGFVVIAWLAGGTLLALVGEDYVAAKTLMVLLLVAGSFELASASVRAAAYAMGEASGVLRIHLVAVAMYVLLYFIFTRALGLIGPGLASILASLLTLGLTTKLVMKHKPRQT